MPPMDQCTGHPSSHAMTLPATTGFVSQPNCGRGTLDIIWTCLSTIFLSIWVTGHIKIGAPGSSSWSVCRLRIITAIGSFFLPEVVVSASILNLLRALWLQRKISPWLRCAPSDSTFELDQSATFSLRQAFVFVKEGVYLASELEPVKSDQLEDLLQSHKLDFRDIPTNDEIDDRSKSDWILKTFSIFQTIWFLAAILYPLRVNLQVSLLEDMTAAHAFCGFVQLVAWLRCPQDICQGWRLEPKTSSGTAPEKNNTSVANTNEPDALGSLRKTAASFNPTPVEWVSMTFSATIFVGFHLAPWRYPFATVAEKWLWISCSVATLFLLIILFPLIWMSSRKDQLKPNKPLTIAGGFAVFLYVPVRLIMISLAFVAFRDAPTGIYEKPSWEDLLPHL